MEKTLTGYPSIDKPWMKYYSEEYKNMEIPRCTMLEMVYNNNQDNLKGNAFCYFDKKTTYEQFFKDIDRMAKAFLAYGIKAGDIITVVSLTTPIAVTAMYAMNKIGAVPSFVNVLSTAEEFAEYFESEKTETVITLDLFGKNVFEAAEKTGVKRVIVYSLTEGTPAVTSMVMKFKLRKVDRSFMNSKLAVKWEDFILSGDGQPEITYKKNPDELAYMGHTGGTTGFPKGVLLNDHSFNFVAQNYDIGHHHAKGDVFLNAMIPYVVYSAIDNIHMPLALSMELVLIPKFDPAEWATYIKKYRPNICAVIPAYLAPMTTDPKVKKLDLSCFKVFGLGGDGMNIPLEEAALEMLTGQREDHFDPLIKGYGMSEVCATAVTEYSYANKIGSVGIPLPRNIAIAYNNEEQHECKYGEVGEIIMQCESLMMGYKDNEEETKNLVRTHPDGSQWIHTGDLGYVDEDGFLFIEGRMKRIIMTVIDGKVYKIFPSKVEGEISKNSGVYDVCVSKAMDGTNQVLKAFVIPEKGVDFDALVKELRAQCEANLPDNMRPMFYEKLEDFPRTAAGKLDYKALEE